MNPANYWIPRRHRLVGQTTRQPLSNFKPLKPWKYKQLSGLRPDASCLLKTLSVTVEGLDLSTKEIISILHL